MQEHMEKKYTVLLTIQLPNICIGWKRILKISKWSR